MNWMVCVCTCLYIKRIAIKVFFFSIFCECAEARAEIVGGPEKFYKAGSSVELRCDLIDSTEEPEYVFWYQASYNFFFSSLLIFYYAPLFYYSLSRLPIFMYAWMVGKTSLKFVLGYYRIFWIDYKKNVL